MCIKLNRKLNELDRAIAVTPDYVSKVSMTYSNEEDGSKPSTSTAHY